jgi:hypothetical protein
MQMKRREAKALGLDKYNTGKPCRNGHLADRYTSSGACLICHKETAIRNVDSNNQASKKYKEIHKEEISLKNKEKYRLKKSIFSSI